MKLSNLSTVLSISLYLRLGNASPVFHGTTNKDLTRQQPLALDDLPPLEPTSIDSLPKSALNDDHEPDIQLTTPDWPTTHLLARRLLAVTTTGTLSTVYTQNNRNSELIGVPIGLPDYFADCAHEENPTLLDLLGPGNPLILALHLGTTFRNTKAGSNVTLSIDWWDRSADDGTLDNSPAALPRLALLGWLEPLPAALPDDTKKAIEKCFMSAHPESKFWLPGRPDAAHTGYWARLVVEKALWIGGYGDRAKIGWLNPQVWKSITKNGNDDDEGWDDVRLPGEKE